MSRRKLSGTNIAVLVLILVAFLCRMSYLYDCPFYVELGFLRSFIYIALPIGWGISVARRVIQPQLRRYLECEAWLIAFWIVLRTLNYNILDDPVIAHWVWYLYYIPMTLIPLLGIFISKSLFKPENYRTPKKLKLLYLPFIILITLVLTNDLHQTVFIFPQGATEYTAHDYEYSVVYYFYLCWVVFCIAFSLTAVITENRKPDLRKRMVIPAMILLTLAVYFILYCIRVPFVKRWFNDMTVITCLLTIVLFESFFHLNLIQTNTHYGELFRKSSVPVCIVDGQYKELSRSENFSEIPANEMLTAEKTPVITKNNIRISSAPIRIGHVLWEEDVTELVEQIRDLEDTNERLEESNTVAAEEYRTSLRQRQLVEQNRLYDKMQAQTERQVLELESLVESLAAETESSAVRKLLIRLGVLGAYIKRRNNLIFLAENQSQLSASELMYCVRESLQNLSVFDIPSDQYFALGGELPFDGIVLLYDAFEHTLETALDTLTDIFVSVTAEKDAAVLSVRLCTDADLTSLKKHGIRAVREEPGEWIVTVSASRQGGTER